jgi:hypothetical protein
MPGVGGSNEFDQLNLIFSENEARPDANPIHQAQLLQKMMRAGQLNQSQLAKRKGKSNAWVSDYLSFLDFPEEALRIFSSLKIKAWALRSVKRLPTPELQIQIAKELKAGTIKPEGVERRVYEVLTEFKSRRRSSSQRIHTGGYETKWSSALRRPGIPFPEHYLPPPPSGWKPIKEVTGLDRGAGESDPLAEFWKTAGFDPDISIVGIPKVTYLGGLVWSFEVPATGVTASSGSRHDMIKSIRDALSRWFLHMAHVLDTSKTRAPTSKVRRP